MRQVRGHSGRVDDVVQAQPGHRRVQLEQERQGLANACGDIVVICNVLAFLPPEAPMTATLAFIWLEVLRERLKAREGLTKRENILID